MSFTSNNEEETSTNDIEKMQELILDETSESFDINKISEVEQNPFDHLNNVEEKEKKNVEVKLIKRTSQNNDE